MTTPALPFKPLSPTAGLLIFAAIALGLWGFSLALAEIALGGPVIGFGCLLGIWSRIAQATAHHRDVLARLELLIPADGGRLPVA